MPVFKQRNTIRARELRNAAAPAERFLWRYLSHSRLGAKFSHQMPVGPFFADFPCRERKLIIGLDDFSHDIDPGRDGARDRYLRDTGYRVLHFPNAEVLANVEGVITSLRLALGKLPTPGPSRKREGGDTAADRNATS